MGVNRERVIMLTFLIGGMMAGVAALLYITQDPQANVFDVGFLLGVKAFTAAVLGGIGNLRGALLGGLVLGVVENCGQALFGTRVARRHRVRAAGARAAVPADRASSASRSGRHAHDRPDAPPTAAQGARPLRRRGCADRWDDAGRGPPVGGPGVSRLRATTLLPLFDAAVPDQPGTNFGGADGAVRDVRADRVGLNVVVGHAGLLDLGYVGFYAIGAYTVGAVRSARRARGNLMSGTTCSTRLGVAGVLPLAMCVTAISGLILGAPTLRVRGDYLAIVTLGFGEIVRLRRRQPRRDSAASAGSRPASPASASIPGPGGPPPAGNTSSACSTRPWWYWLG